jgi:hypothetical protein
LFFFPKRRFGVGWVININIKKHLGVDYVLNILGVVIGGCAQG